MTIEIGQRVRFQDPDAIEERLENERRGRVTYTGYSGIQVIEDGKKFAIWLRRKDVRPERESAAPQIDPAQNKE